MTRCARCGWRGETPSEHAAETGHPLCAVCGRRSLTVHEALTCGHCIGRVRADLADIATAYALLEPASVNHLALLGDGTMQRRGPDETFHRYELEGIRDEWDHDPLPVLAALASWEDFIREHYGAAKGPPDPTLTVVIDYLTRNLDTGHVMAQTFLAFDEFAAEVGRHRSAVQHAAGLADVPLRAPAVCFDCGGQLLRTYRPTGKAPDVVREGMPFEGLSDDWTCSGCRGVYSQPEYYLAVRAELERRREDAS